MYTWDEHCKEDGGESPYIVSPSSIIEKLPPVTPKQPGWIPCSERCPDKEGIYLVTDKTVFGEKISMRYWNIHEKDAFWSGYESDVVLAWMEMPKPYREGGTG